MELSQNGKETYKKDKKKFVETVKGVCLANKIPIVFQEFNNGRIELSLTDQNNKGIFISTEYENPFFLDNDEDYSYTNDCPSLTEIYYRLWNMNMIKRFDQPYKRSEVLDDKFRERALAELKKPSQEFLEQSQNSRLSNDQDEIIDLLEKSTIISAFNSIEFLYSKKELADEIKEYIKENLSKEDRDFNVTFMKEFWTDTKNVLHNTSTKIDKNLLNLKEKNAELDVKKVDLENELQEKLEKAFS